MKIVAFIPIKLNNERLPGKNTKSFTNGKPLISYILETLISVNKIDEIYVYCSDESICQYLPEGVSFLQRKSYLDLSTTSFNEVLTTFAEAIEADIYVLAHATAPFITKKSFEVGIDALVSGKNDSALSVKKMQEFIWRNNLPFNYDPSKIPRTQDLESFYIETCGMYIFTRDLIIKEKRRIGHHPYLVEVSQIEATDINNLEDFLLADAIYNTLIKKE